MTIHLDTLRNGQSTSPCPQQGGQDNQDMQYVAIDTLERASMRLKNECDHVSLDDSIVYKDNRQDIYEENREIRRSEKVSLVYYTYIMIYLSIYLSIFFASS